MHCAIDERNTMSAVNVGFPEADVAITQILVVSDIERSRRFWTEVVGAEPYREYGGASVVLQFAGAWLLLVTGGEPSSDKPTVTFAPPSDPNRVSHAMTIRVRDCWYVYTTLSTRGAEFLTPPYQWGAEIRCYFRDPDGHLIEVSQVGG
jgi:catechol 2,3-dioxygenase-like lactoylglutathione lyase family enzyme